jgi:D-xylonolactonase
MSHPAVSRGVIQLANYHCGLGENPLWHSAEQSLYWEDIDSGRLFRARPASGQHECFFEGDVIGGFSFQESGDLLLFERNRIALLDPASGERRVIVQGVDGDMARFNDVIADPEGRVFAGTIGTTERNGGLYLVERDASVRCLWKDTGIANGMAFSGDLKRFFWTDSTHARIFVFDYDRTSGSLTNRRLFYQADTAEGTPDGMTIDQDDHLWSTRWDGSAVLRINPDGRVVDRIELPVSKVSSATFGGPELDTLFLTSAGGRAGLDSADGAVFSCRPGVRGRAAFKSRIGPRFRGSSAPAPPK